jgi:hypothetical protein
MNPYKFWLGGRGWKALWIALRRAPRDAQARRNILRLLASFIPLLVLVGWYAFFIHGAVSDLGWGGLIPGAIGFLLSIGIGFIIVGRQKLQERAYERDNPAVSSMLKVGLYRETCLLATLLERLGSEAAIEKELPPEITVITRRVLLDRLTQLELRDGLEPWLLDILLAPDGHWPVDLKQRAFPAWECLVVLRWVLGLGDLPALTESPKYSLDDAQSLFEVEHPERGAVLPAWDIRPARNQTDTFFSRCWSELIARRQLSGVDENDVARAVDARESIKSEGYTADYLIGARTIPELENPVLWQITVRAYNRWQILALLVDIMSEEKLASELRGLFAHFFGPREAMEAPA